MKHTLLGIPVVILYITKYSVSENRFDELDKILNDFQESFLSLENKNVFEKAVKSDKIETRSKRDMPTMYMGKKKKLRTCANMNGILGGSNAFNYISFVLAILTLVVNTNNNINNNNNNLNQANLNTASNNNANANSNNNNANVVNVMPPGKKKRKRRAAPHPFDVYEDRVCLKSEASSLSGELSLAAMILIQKYFQSQLLSKETCKTRMICENLTEITSLGLGGRLLVTGVRTALRLSQDIQCEDIVEDETSCDPRKDKNEQIIQCGRCGHEVSRASEIITKESSHDVSTTIVDLFDRPNVTVHEFINPAQIHFRSMDVGHADCEARDHDTWQGGDTWYEGARWRVCYCPMCGQALGWRWRQFEGSEPVNDWVGLRLGQVASWKNFLFGPLSSIPNLINSLG